MEIGAFPHAASHGNVNLVKELIASGDNVNAVDSNGATSLHLAISSERNTDVVSQIIRELLQAGASLEARNHEGYTPLHIAAMIGHVDFVDQLIRADADVDAEVDSKGVTSLILAIESDQPDNDRTEVIRLLVESGASLEKRDASGHKPLRMAVTLGKVNVVRQLILSGANVNEVNSRCKSILLAAAKSRKNDEGAYEIIQMLLEAGASPNTSDFEGITPLRAATSLGNARKVDQLIKAGADVNAIDQSKHRTILHYAMSRVESDEDNLEVLQLLLKAGASLSTYNRNSCNALHLATSLRKVKIVEQLILAGANVDSTHPELDESCLHKIAKAESEDDSALAMIRLLLDAGAKIDSCDRNQRTPLHNAVEKGNMRIIEHFIKAGANVNAEDSQQQSVLSAAVLSRMRCDDRLKIVCKLLHAGASVESSNIYGKPLLHDVVASGCVKIVEILISAGANVCADDRNGNSCLHAAVYYARELYAREYSAIIQILLDAGAPLNKRNDQGQTPLHTAVSRGYVKGVESLIEAGADVSVEDKLGETSLHLAVELENFDERSKIIGSLLKAGASVVKRDLSDMTPLHYVIMSRKLLTVEIVDLLQAYAVEHPNSEIPKGLKSICGNEDGNYDHLEVIRLLLTVDVLVDKQLTPLHYAVNAGDVALVKRVLKDGGAHIDATTRDHKTGLHLACSRLNSENINCRQILQLLLEAGASVDVADRENKTPLIYALLMNDKEMVQQLIAAGADYKIITDKNMSCLHYVILSEDYRDTSPVTSILINAGALVNIEDEIFGQTPLHYAVTLGYRKTVEQLIRAGADVNAVNHSGMTSLHCIPRSPDFLRIVRHHSRGGYCVSLWNHHHFHEIVKLLLKAGAKIDACDENGETPLVLAVHAGDPLLVEQLINAGADADAITEEGCTVLVSLCQNPPRRIGEDFIFRIVSLLVAAGAEVIVDGDESSPRHLALTNGLQRVYNWYEACRKEVQLMRETSIHAPITYYQILRRRGELSYFRNKSVIEEFERGEFTKLFPIFCKDLEKSFQATQIKRGLMNQASNGLCHILGFSHEPIHDRILNHLNDWDLVNLCHVNVPVMKTSLP